MPEKLCCQQAELSALMDVNSILFTGSTGEVVLKFGSENASVARKIFKLNKVCFGKIPKVFVAKKSSFKKNNFYTVKMFLNAPHSKLLDLESKGLRLESNNDIENLKQCCVRAYLRGAFLGGGSLIDPRKTYHLEITSPNDVLAQKISRYMEQYDLKPGISLRKQWHVVYLKEAEQIAHFLNVVGAHSSLLSLENIRIYKGMRNRVNRLVNCETANMSKSINASLRQIEAIEAIGDTLGLAKLPNDLYEVARLRLENPDASLKELGQMLKPPLSKSSVNYRMRKLVSIASKIKSH